MKILIVEDEAKIANFLISGLSEEGHKVQTAADGKTGLELALNGGYDLIVLDRMLPEMDGVTICRTLRDQGHAEPILMLTAKDTVEDRVAGLDAGADDYLTKPFAFTEFLARVRAQERRVQGSRTRIQVADLVIDVRYRRVTRAGVPIELSGKEYSLLEYLAEHMGEVLSRADISREVWDINYDTFTNIIDVHINRLRKKIDQGAAVKLIHTVRGSGYMLKEQ